MLKVVTTPTTITPTTFTVAVPGLEVWSTRTVCVTVQRAVGGAPNRAYLLSVFNNVDIVAQAGADDGGTEPGSARITWCGAPKSVTVDGSLATIVAPFPSTRLDGGYVLEGTILNPAPGDAWSTVAVWTDYVTSSP